LEQIVLYLAILAALAGFGMGLLNLAGPFLRRRSIVLPSLSIATLLRRGQTDDDFDGLEEDDLDAGHDFAATNFAAADISLLAPRLAAAPGLEDEELDEELVQVLEEVAEEEGEPAEGDEDVTEDEDEGPFIYTVSAEAADETQDDEDEDDEAEDDEADEDDDEDDVDDDGDEDMEEPEAGQPEVQVAGGGGGEGDDMLSFFSESADAGADAAAAWRQDLPDVSIEDLLAEARAVSQQITDKKRNAA